MRVGICLLATQFNFLQFTTISSSYKYRRMALPYGVPPKSGVTIFACGNFAISILAVRFIRINKCTVKTDTYLSLKR